jgi:cytochrome c biogenesis protein CcmG/thiol:disulfide interchange protein DsbE
LRILTLMTTLLTAGLLAPEIVAAGAVKPGDAAPAIRLPAADGKVVALADLKGRVVLVDFWASWCAPCRSAFPAVDGLYTEFRERGFDVLAINVDERRKDADAFLVDHPPTFTVLFDPKGQSPKDFGVAGMPTSFLVGRDGRIRFVHTGYTARTTEDYRREIELLLRETAPGDR